MVVGILFKRSDPIPAAELEALEDDRESLRRPPERARRPELLEPTGVGEKGLPELLFC